MARSVSSRSAQVEHTRVQAAGLRTVRVVNTLLGAQLDKRLPVLLKRAGSGDDHLLGRGGRCP